MANFFSVQSWLALAICALIFWLLVPFAGTFAPLIGAVLSSMCLCGKPAYDYMHDAKSDRDDFFRSRMMSPNVRFRTETFTQIIVTACLFFLSVLSGWRVLWFFAGGGFVSIACFIMRGVCKHYNLPR